jgi:hypothetical protein
MAPENSGSVRPRVTTIKRSLDDDDENNNDAKNAAFKKKTNGVLTL